MRYFIAKNRWFVVGLIATILVGFLLVHGIGFWKMAKTIAPNPERLRDYTFPIWDQYSFLQHGFLVFITQTGFKDGIGYSNHSTAYLVFMYLFYKLELAVPQLLMRVVVGYIEMTLLILSVIYVLASRINEKVFLGQGILILLSMLFLVTMPDYWISAGKFNVDNVFHLQMPMLLLVAHQLSQDVHKGPKLWLPLGLFCLFAPMMAAVLAAFLAVSSLQKEGWNKELLSLSALILLVSVLVYLQPVLVAKLLGFKSANSSWVHRAGLEGDPSSFNNAINAVILPFYPRPFYLVLAPLFLLLALLLWLKWGSTSKQVQGNDARFASKRDFNLRKFFLILFSQYLVIVLLWPQSVSIHPYLYDFLLVAPMYVWIVLNFSLSDKFLKIQAVCIWLMLFFISFNLQQIAQARQCFYCFYPTWVPNQHVIKP